jgi:hypothetical protein
MSKDRDEYGWDDVPSDLALSTPLTLMDAGRVAREIQATGVHPYDALPALIVFFADGHQAEERAAAMRRLIEAAKTEGTTT